MATVSRPVVYPESDGKPMAESDAHRLVMTESIETLDDFFAHDPRVYVSGNLLLYYEEGNPRKCLSPDVLIKKKSRKGKGRRRVYLTWEEGGAPDAVVEISSRKTRREDLESKFRLYRDVLQVKEYFLFDPLEEYLDPPLQGFRLRGGKYVPIPEVNGRVPSVVLGLHLEKDGQRLRFFNPPTGQYLLSRAEGQAKAEQAQQQADRARRRAEQARQQAERDKQQAEQARQLAEQGQQQAEQARQLAEQGQQQAEQARQQAEQDKQQAEHGRRQAEREKQQAELAQHQAEAEVDRLRRELQARPPRRGGRNGVS